MKKILKIVIYTLLIFSSIAFINACNSDDHAEHAGAEVFTCPMHPSVRSDRPAACPICGMDLVKIEQMPSADTPGAENVIFIMPRQQILANVRTDSVRYSQMGENNLLLGTVATDPRNTTTITAKVPGRIERLLIRNPQEKVNQGQALYEIYSEELLVEQKEYLLSLKKSQENPQNETLKLMLEASRNKLMLWGMSASQLKTLERNGIASARTTFYSPASGYLQELLVQEGQYVEIGSPIGTWVKLNTLWIEAQVYPEELSLLQKNPEVSIEAVGIRSSVKGKLVYQNPAIEEGSRVTLARFEVQNHNQLQPGMMVYVRLQTPLKKTLVVPKSALLPETMPTAWVKIGDDAFERRMLKLGVQNRQFAEVLEGLKEGEQIVTSGAYLINSEFVLKKGSTQAHNH